MSSDCTCDETYNVETIQNVETRWHKTHKTHYDYYFTWRILLTSPTNYRERNKQLSLNNKLETKTLQLYSAIEWCNCIELFTDSDAILNFSPVVFCVKWLNEPYILFLWKSVNFQDVLIFGSCVTCRLKFTFLRRLWPWKNSHIPCGEWEFNNIGQEPSSNIFVKIPLCTSVISVFIVLQNIYSSEYNWTSLIFTRPEVVLTRNRNFKTAVNLLETKLHFVFIFHLTSHTQPNTCCTSVSGLCGSPEIPPVNSFGKSSSAHSRDWYIYGVVMWNCACL